MIYRNKNLLAIKGILFKFPAVLINYIADIFGHGWDRNRAIDSIGNHGNALMGGYLLASSNLTISISGLLTTDTLVALTDSGLVGSINTDGLISFTEGLNYGAFEVYRETVLIGRFCLTERQGSRLINQVTGTLGNGLLGGTLTTVWQRSNAFYSETNANGYSISETDWVTNNGEALTVGTLISADLSNPNKCMAYVGGVQQDLQFVGKAQNSVSVVPYCAYCNADRSWNGISFSGALTSHYVLFRGIINEAGVASYPYGTSGSSVTDTRNRGLYMYYTQVRTNYSMYNSGYVAYYVGVPITIEGGYNGATGIIYIRVTDETTGRVTYTETTGNPSSITVTSFTSRWGTNIKGYIGEVKEIINGNTVLHAVPDQHSTNFIDLKNKVNIALVGISTDLHQNIDLVYNTFNQTGYELWKNGTDYLIYPLASDGTTIISPVGYTLVETVTAGNMPSVADARFTTFKYALANSYAVRKRVPEAYNTDAQSTPKHLTYSELKDLENNHKIRITESDNKITNLKILQ